MKKYSIIALFVALVVSLSSCNDDFMQRNRKHSASCVFFSPLFLPTFVASL